MAHSVRALAADALTVGNTMLTFRTFRSRLISERIAQDGPHRLLHRTAEEWRMGSMGYPGRA